MIEKPIPEEILKENLAIAQDLDSLYGKYKKKDTVLASDAKEASEFYLSQSLKK